MSKVALVVTLQFQPEAKAAFMEALFAHQQRCLATEPGTLQFDIMAPQEPANAVVLFELYAGADALDAHNEGRSLALFREQAGALITQADLRQCDLLTP